MRWIFSWLRQGHWFIKRVHVSEAIDKLNTAIAKAIANSKWTSLPDGTTYCNDFCQEILGDLGCHDLDGLLARDMGEKVLSLIASAGDSISPWQEITWQKAIENAKIGIPVLGWAEIPEEKHAHVVIVAPEDPEESGTFGGLVPMCASIARNPFQNRIMKISEAYRVANKPRYFAWLG